MVTVVVEEEVVVEVNVVGVEVEAEDVLAATETTKILTKNGQKVHTDQQMLQKHQGAASSAPAKKRFSYLLTRTIDRLFSAAFGNENRIESSVPRRSWNSV